MRQSGSGIAWQGFSQVRLSHLTCHPASVTLSSQFNFDASCPVCWPDGINAPRRPCTPSGLADRSLSSPRAWTIVLSEAHHPRNTARRTGRSVNAYALRQPDYLARGIGGMVRIVLAVETASDSRSWSSQPCAGGVRCGHRSSLGPATAQPPGSRLSLEVP